VEKKKGKRKRRKGKEKEEKKTENRKKENKGRKMEKGFRKLGEFLGKLGEGFLRIFLCFLDTGVNSGTAVMARRTGRRDRGVRGIPGVVADRGAGVTRDVRQPEHRRCRRDSRHARRGKGIDRGFERGLNELSGKVLKTRVIY
jgi:hypothetical protein